RVPDGCVCFQVFGGNFLQTLSLSRLSRHLLQGHLLLEWIVVSDFLDSVFFYNAQTQQAQVAIDHVTGALAQRGGEAAVDAVDASDLEALPDDGQPGVAGEGAATGAELYVGHGTVWVNGDNGYIAMQVSGLEVLPGAGLTDSGEWFGSCLARFGAYTQNKNCILMSTPTSLRVMSNFYLRDRASN
ncbi:MAG: hypothetical protein P3W96_012840, partial [Halomonas sp.]